MNDRAARPVSNALIAAYVRVFGEDLAIKLFIQFGGVHFRDASIRNGIVDLLTCAVFGNSDLSECIPRAQLWVAETLFDKGKSSAEIGEIMRLSPGRVESLLLHRGAARRATG